MAAVQDSRSGRTGATTTAERQTGKDHTVLAAVHELRAKIAESEAQNAACLRAVAALTRAVQALGKALGAEKMVDPHLDEVNVALRTLTDPHADAKAAQAAEKGGAGGDLDVPF